MRALSHRPFPSYVALLLGVLGLTAGCGETDNALPVAVPGLQVDDPQVALGSPVELTYRFQVLPDVPAFGEDYRVFMHVLDADGSMIFDDDHNPPTPTSAWKPGDVIEYTRTIFYPIYPYLGRATLEMGLYSTTSGERVRLQGDEVEGRAYRVGEIDLRPQTDNIFLAYDTGWHDREVSDDREAIEWRWTEGHAAVSFDNPKTNVVIYFNADQPAQFAPPQVVTLRAGEQVINEFMISPGPGTLRKIPVEAAQLGESDSVVLSIDVSPAFVPAEVAGSGSDDPRELGIRVFNLHVEPR